MSMFSDWTPSELDYLLSLSDTELESTILGVPEDERASLTKAMLARLEQLKNDRQIPTKLQLCEALQPSLSVTMLDRYVAKGMRLDGPPYSLMAAQAEYERVRKETGVDAAGSDAELRRERTKIEIAEKIQNERSKRIKNDKLERKTVPTAQVVQWVRMAFNEVRRELETIPDAAQKVVPAEFRPQIFQEVKSVVASVLKRLAAKRIEETELLSGDVDVP